MRSLLIAAGLLLALPVAAKEKPQVPAELVSTHGYVHVAFPKGGGQAFSVQPVAGGKSLAVDAPAATIDLPTAQAFGKWLPAGKYRVTTYGAMKWNDGPQFEVRAGQVTDMGDFVPVNVGGYQIVLVPTPHAEHAGSVAVATRSFAPLLKDPTSIAAQVEVVSPAMVIGQKASGLGLIADLLLAHDRKVNKPSTLDALVAAKQPDEFVRLLRTTVPPLQDEPAQLADGTLLFPADFGQVRKRSPRGEWSNLGIDTLRQILAVEAVDGRLVTGSDDGRLRESSDGGATWKELKALGRKESIIDIDQAGGTWVVTSTETFDDPDAPRGGGFVVAPIGASSVRMRVYTGQRGDLGDLAVSRQFTLTPKDQAGWLGARGQLVEGRYYVLAGTALQRLDLASRQWTTITPGARIGSHRIDPDSGVITALWSQGAFSKVYVSSDRGASWTQIGRPPYIIHDVQMDSMKDGWASRWNMGAFGGTWETYRFASAKDDWDKSGEAPFNCKLMRIAKTVPVLCITNDASIVGLHGGKWEAEFSAL